MAIKNEVQGGLIHLPKLPDKISYSFAKDMRSHVNTSIGEVLRQTRKSTEPVSVCLYMGAGTGGTATWEYEDNAALCIQITSEREPVGPRHDWTCISVDLVDHVLRRETGITKSDNIRTVTLRVDEVRDRYIGIDINMMGSLVNRAIKQLVNYRKTELGLPLGYTQG